MLTGVSLWCILLSQTGCAAIQPCCHSFNINMYFFSTAKVKHWYPRSVSQSAVMSATFAKFHPNVVVGGTYSGQIVLWDNRSNKRTPVQRTPLSAAAHTVLSVSAGRYFPFSWNKSLKSSPPLFWSTQFTVSMWSAPRMLTTWLASPPMARCAPGVWTCSRSHR